MTKGEAIIILSKMAEYEDIMDLIENHSVSVQDALHLAIKALLNQPEPLDPYLRNKIYELDMRVEKLEQQFKG